MENEKVRILRMIQEGKLTAEEGAELLEAMDLDDHQENVRSNKGTGASEDKATVLHVEVTNLYSGEIIRDIKFPLTLVRKLTGIVPPSFFGKVDMDLPGGLDIRQIVSFIESPYPAVLYETDEGEQHIRVFTE